MASARKTNTKPKYGHSPDRFDDSQVMSEQPDKQEYHRQQEGLVTGDTVFSENKPVQNRWTVATDELQRIARKTKGCQK